MYKRQEKELVAAAADAINRVFKEGNRYHVVGAALRARSGAVFTGVNCDGIHGSCAEFEAMGAAKIAGEIEYDCIVAVASPDKGNQIVSPCGNCRQMLFEYCPDIRVIVLDEEKQPLIKTARELLPYPYVEL